MANPIAVAVQGKGFLPMLRRGGAIVGRYGLTTAKMESELKCLVDTVLTFGCRATLPITAAPMARHPKPAQKLHAQGIELAVHGLKHVDHTQLPIEMLVSDLQQAVHIFSKAGLHAAGFRSPYLRWNADTLAALKTCGFEYDSSQALTWDVTASLETPSYKRVLEFYGAQQAANHMALPNLQDDLVRIPYCLPDDEALIERMGLKDGHAMAEIWLAMLDWTYASGELFTLGLHPERAALCRAALWAVLEKASFLSPGIWIARLDEIARWQRLLASAKFQAHQEEKDQWRIVVQAANVTILARSVEIAGPTQTWAGKYQRVFDSELSVRSNRRPWIGLAPDCPPALRDFLVQQGFLTETSIDPAAYTFYLQRSAFDSEDERPILAEIEAGDWPLVRIARWPGGAKSALVITGDVDAFNLWDYGQRILDG